MNGPAAPMSKPFRDSFEYRVQMLSDVDRDRFEEHCRQVERALERRPNELGDAMCSLTAEGWLRDLLLVHAGRCWLEHHGNSEAAIAELIRDFPAFNHSDWVVQQITAWLEDPNAEATTNKPDSTASNNSPPGVSNPPASGIDPASDFKLPAQYVLIRNCKKSGMGRAFIVQHTRVKRLEVLKTANALVLSDSAALNRFKEEPLMASRFNHPGIVTVYNVDESDGMPYFTMEFMNAGSLADRLQAGPIPLRQAAQLIATACRVMQMIHEKGRFTHGDIKPENLLFTRTDDGTECMKVADFGLTRPIPADWKASPSAKNLQPNQLPQTHDLTGTPGYLPPEAFDADFRSQHETEVLGRSADIFAMGVTLYRCLTGHMPYQNSEAQVDLLGPVLNELRPPSELNPIVDPVLGAICRRALAKSSDERFGDFREFADSLEDWLRDVSPRASSGPSLATTVIQPGRVQTAVRRLRSRRSLTAVAIVVPILAILLGQWAVAHKDGKRGVWPWPVKKNGSDPPPSTIADLKWEPSAKEAFETRYGDWFRELSAKSPDVAQAALKRLNALGQDRETSPISLVLQSNPELAFALADAQQPEAISQELNGLHGEEQVVFLNLLAIYPGNRASDQMILAWKKHKVAICELWQRGLVGSEAIFISRGAGAGDELYDKWLADLFSGANLSPRDLAERLCLVQAQGSYLRDRLATDEGFRQSFEQLWDKLKRVTADQRRPLTLFMGYSLTWDYLSLPDGEDLAHNFGLLPAKLFVGKDLLPADVQPAVKRILYERRIDALDGLLDDRLRASIIRLLREKDLSALDYSIAISKLLHIADADRKELLERFLRMSVDDLKEEFKVGAPPETWDNDLRGYLKVAKRLVTGQKLDKGDMSIAVSNAIGDAVSACSGVISGATSGVVPPVAIEFGAKVTDGWVTQHIKEEIRRQREENNAAAARGSTDAFAQREQTIAEFCASQPTVALRIILEMPAAECRASSAAIGRYFWSQNQECAPQTKMLRERVGRLSLLPSGRLICMSNKNLPKAGLLPSYDPTSIPDEETPWRGVLADWWQESFMTTLTSN